MAEGVLSPLFSGHQQQKRQISRRALAPVKTTLVYTIRIKKRYMVRIAFNHSVSQINRLGINGPGDATVKLDTV
jgi:hypothetical protein